MIYKVEISTILIEDFLTKGRHIDECMVEEGLPVGCKLFKVEATNRDTVALFFEKEGGCNGTITEQGITIKKLVGY